jgi:hypothetical protein
MVREIYKRIFFAQLQNNFLQKKMWFIVSRQLYRIASSEKLFKFYCKSSASEKRMGEKRACTNFHSSVLTEGAPVHEQKELR